MAAVQFLTRVGQACTPVRQEMIFLSDVLGVLALADVLNAPVMGGATKNSVLIRFTCLDCFEARPRHDYLRVTGFSKRKNHVCEPLCGPQLR
ncbi:hypothetical protein EV363DRAFT_789936 [Boletus edulis]|nr:hypothetical protein EV363DRAFT_789936 [Boletus edulis]